jgi:hypothetical protein
MAKVPLPLRPASARRGPPAQPRDDLITRSACGCCGTENRRMRHPTSRAHWSRSRAPYEKAHSLLTLHPVAILLRDPPTRSSHAILLRDRRVRGRPGRRGGGGRGGGWGVGWFGGKGESPVLLAAQLAHSEKPRDQLALFVWRRLHGFRRSPLHLQGLRRSSGLETAETTPMLAFISVIDLPTNYSLPLKWPPCHLNNRLYKWTINIEST